MFSIRTFEHVKSTSQGPAISFEYLQISRWPLTYVITNELLDLGSISYFQGFFDNGKQNHFIMTPYQADIFSEKIHFNEIDLW